MKIIVLGLIVIVLLGMKVSDTKTVYVKERCECELVGRYYLNNKRVYQVTFGNGVSDYTTTRRIRYATVQDRKSEVAYDSIRYDIIKKYTQK